nr:hypothetical protein GCM10020092_004900 [Actinoplanes digitatis]
MPPHRRSRRHRTAARRGPCRSCQPPRPAIQAPAAPYISGAPVAGRFPPLELPSAGRFIEPEPAIVVEGPIIMSTASDAIQLPHQRLEPIADQQPAQPHSPEARNAAPAGPLRRRVPGNQMPIEAGPRPTAAPTPTSDDALAAREAFEAFEAGGVARAVGRHRAGHVLAARRRASAADPAGTGRDAA